MKLAESSQTGCRMKCLENFHAQLLKYEGKLINDKIIRDPNPRLRSCMTSIYIQILHTCM